MMASQDQMARAARCARQLGARNPVPHSLYKAMLALVESIDKPGPPEKPKPPPVSDARRVLAPKKPRPQRAAVKPVQEGLW